MGNTHERLNLVERAKKATRWNFPRGRARFLANLAGAICFSIGLAGHIGLAVEVESEVIQKASETGVVFPSSEWLILELDGYARRENRSAAYSALVLIWPVIMLSKNSRLF